VIDAYFLCATPRTGSSLLLGLLGATGVCGRPQAYFRAPDIPLWAARWGLPAGFGRADYVRAARAAGSTPNGVFGAKLMWGALDEVDPLDEAFGTTRFVHLERDDVVAQAVSWLRAEQTGVWFVGGNGEISGNDAERGGPPVFDAGAIRRLVGTIGEHNAAWRSWFAARGVVPHRVSYEELNADMAGATRGVLHFLGIEAAGDLAARHRRQADALNQEWAARYKAEAGWGKSPS
jgi:LPS sulfotransferase NodH